MIEVIKLPKEVVNGLKFEDLYALRPEDRSVVSVLNRETGVHYDKTIYRAYMSYLHTPEFDKDTGNSYMFNNKSKEVPTELKKFVDFAQSLDPAYNQMVVNWYDSNDYIELHSDCTKKMIENEADILVINLNETEDLYKIRHFTMVDQSNNQTSSLPLINNSYFIINNNLTHKHFVGQGSEKRISITFRKMKV